MLDKHNCCRKITAGSLQ